MKKTLAIILILAIAVSMLAGCGGEKANLTGKYVFTSMAGGDNEIDFGALLGMLGMDAEDSMFLEFSSNGKCSMHMMGEVMEGTFIVSGKNVDITIDGDTATGAISGNKITLEQDGMKMVFEKK